MALKQEALQHLFITIAGMDCRELWNLLTLFFGKGSDHDPFEFLDAAPAIKKPLDLVDTDSNDKADSSTSTATNTPDPTADSPKPPELQLLLVVPRRTSSFWLNPPGLTSMLLLNWPKGLYPDQQVFYTTPASLKGSLAGDRTLKQLKALVSTYAHTPAAVLPPTLAISQVADCIYIMSTMGLVYCAPSVLTEGIIEFVGGRIT